MKPLRSGFVLLCVPVALANLSSCSRTTTAEAQPPPTVGISDLPSSAPTTSVATEPTTTEPTTTEAPTTTTAAAPTTTAPTNVEVVGAFPVALKAVGTKSGSDTAVLQLRLAQLGFWNGMSDGQYGMSTTQAVMAFQKYIGLPASGKVDDATAQFMQNVTERARGQADTGTLVEIDKTKQLLFLVVDGKTLWTFNTSTGSEQPYEAVNKKDPTKVEKGDSVTPNGLWEVTRERPEGWWEGDLGEIYRPKYFNGGIAIHGMTSVPNYPASHGCVRLSVPAMDFVWETGLVPVGTPIWVHT